MSEDWAPDACTLPTAERPWRTAEFDALLACVVRAERRDATLLDLFLPRDAEAAAVDLARRESQCCAFFTFGFEAVDDGIVMHIGVPQAQAQVLDALEARCR